MSIESPAAPATDRSRDVSQSLDRLHPDETLKANSDQLRGGIVDGLADPITRAVSPDDQKLMKFHGLYLQDDRDVRDERRRQKLEPAYGFMARVRLPGGVCSPSQWLKLDTLARDYGGGSLRLTTRQTFQFHGVLKHNLRATLQGLRDVLLDTKAACGDDCRGVMCSVNPHLSSLHAEVYALAKRASDHAVPKTGAYKEIWYEEERVAVAGPEEPLYGRTYMPRKFKIGFVVPPINDIDVYAQDLGFIAIIERTKLIGFNIAIGGGMGRIDRNPNSYPRLADVIGFVSVDDLLATIDAVMEVQRDYGDRADRARARFKYTIDDKGLEWVKAEIEVRLGFELAPAKAFDFASNGDTLGWQQGEDGLQHFTLFIENGRIRNGPERRLLDGIQAIAHMNAGEFRVTPNQNLMISNLTEQERSQIEGLLGVHGLSELNRGSGLRLNAMACVALPTCGLAMAESERYLPSLITKIEEMLKRHSLYDEPITMRMTGCPNGCARPYICDIGLTGRAPGKYNLYLGGGFHGQRLNQLVLENVGEAAILDKLGGVLADFARDRKRGEHLGDFALRAGYLGPTQDNSPQARSKKKSKGAR
ncbi:MULTISPECIES: NADPH-dependent assimilatory sulfite reductase hemoprotein subunit [Methyloceanibacter]|uniref:NADPH-dependent assimilatory sulfite reductase hemoprotein subunit n=1 Tax=Methyloceanibacter TaxID=1484898 RepID=UPI0005F09782|nr:MULTISPECIES: NADPH-dependent assimilatory sulfite reductase hemoprotein subunit [Methyloceanibacter]